MNDKGTGQAVPARDSSDTALDALFTAASAGLLAAIRQGVDLDDGLAQIIGAPPWPETHTAENGESSTDGWRLC